MKRFRKYFISGILFLILFCSGCKLFTPVQDKDKAMPAAYSDSKDSSNSAQIKWKDFFADKNLVSLIDTALKNNPDLLIALQDIEIARNDVRLKKGLLFPKVDIAAGAFQEKVGDYTSQGAGDRSADITPGNKVPINLQDFNLGLSASWEVDVWQKLRNSKKAAFARYLGSVEGKNFVVTNLVAEIANSYYELLSLDNQLDVIQQTIQLQKNALEIMKVQKEAGVITELAVKKFEADVLNSQSLEFGVQQQIKEDENKINFLLGRFPQPIVRDTSAFTALPPQQVKAGIPSQLLANRPDIKQAKLELFATKCDVKSAQAEFYPSFNMTAGIGFDAFKLSYLFTTPQSFMYSIAGNLVAPLINRSAIKSKFNQAKAIQIQAMVNYEKTILNGYVEVSNELSSINNLQKTYDLKNKEVETRSQNLLLSIDLFKAGRADYLEVLLTQRDALDSKLELIEVKKQQFISVTNIYKSLGGGWR